MATIYRLGKSAKVPTTNTFLGIKSSVFVDFILRFCLNVFSTYILFLPSSNNKTKKVDESQIMPKEHPIQHIVRALFHAY